MHGPLESYPQAPEVPQEPRLVFLSCASSLSGSPASPFSSQCFFLQAFPGEISTSP